MKTTFSAAVAEKLLTEDEGKGSVGVASIFLDPDDVFVDDHSIFGADGVSVRCRLLESISQQLSCKDMKVEPQHKELDDLRAMVKATCTPSAKIYIIVDGLDRCPAECRRELEDEITTLVSCGCYFMITNYLGLPMDNIVEYTCEKCQSEKLDHYWFCRDCGHKICDECAGGQDCSQAGHTSRRFSEAALALVPNDEDIRMFIDHEIRLRMARREYDDELHKLFQTQLERVENVICRKSSKVFVVCKSLLGYLRDFQRAGYDEIMQVQTRVSRPEEELFNVLMSKIKVQSRGDVKIALTAFSLVSQVPSGSTMTFEDLTNALRLLRVEKTISEQDLYAICQGTLAIRENHTVGPFHDDFGVYLQENCAEDLRLVGVDLALMTTKSLLALPRYDSWTGATEQSLSDTLSEHPFLAFASPNWGVYLRQSTAYKVFDQSRSPRSGSLIEQAFSLMQSPSNFAACLYVANFYDRDFYLWPGCHVLHFCAYYGLTKFINHFSSGLGSPMNAIDPVYGRTPLMVAASRGQAEFAQRLIELGADVSFKCEDGRSALLDAVEYDAGNPGYHDMTMLVLQHMSPSAHSSSLEITPLIACIRKRDHQIFSPQLLTLLVHHPSIDVNEVTLQGHTALMKAASIEGGDVETVDLLLQHHNLRLDVKDKAGKTALHLAAQCAEGEAGVIQSMLLSSHCTPEVLNARDSSGMTVAMLLLRNEYIDREEMVHILRGMSENGIDFHCVDNNGRGLLHAAVAGEQDLAVDYLHLEKKLPLDLADTFGWCAIHYASSTRSHDALSRLLQLGASSTRCDERGWSPLDILRCDDPEDEIVQKICSLLESASLQLHSAAEMPAMLRPAWTFATCKLHEFEQACMSATDDWWLPDPKCGNLVSIKANRYMQSLTASGFPLCSRREQHPSLRTALGED